MTCSSCGADVTAGAKFCSTCGAPLARTENERRVVTVLFADIVGFTTLAERLDPEQVKTQIDRCFNRLTVDITAHGGVVDKVLGDGIVALFGAPVAHEDDAERAVRTALQMQQTLGTMASELQIPFRMRIGVNTGEVLVGSSSVGRDYTAMGDVVNSAARLQSMCEPGSVVVGPATYGATRDAISYHALGEVDLRGRQQALEAWVALAAIRPPGVRTRRSADFVGREAELALLEAQTRVAFELHQAQLTVVYGEAGLGKTRLVEEAAARAVYQGEVRVLEGRCVPYGEANVWWPVAEVLRHLLDLDRDVPDAEIDARLDAALEQVLDTDGRAAKLDVGRLRTAVLHSLGYETSLRGGDRMRNRGEVLLAVTQLIDIELQRRPLVVIFSDMHWASEAVWALVRHLLDELNRRPLLVMITARRSETSEVIDGRFGSLRLELGPLDEAAAGRLISGLGLDADDEDLAALVERSGGNPFFIEELAGLVTAGADVGGLSPGLGTLGQIPDTLRGILAARLDRLEPEARRVLGCAAVLGRSGTRKSLAVMLDRAAIEADLDLSLELLEDADLLSLTSNRFEFVSDLIREVAYATVTKTVRVRYHAGIAVHLEDSSRAPVRNSTAVAIARHFRSAAELMKDLPEVEGVDPLVVAAGAQRWLDEAGWRALDAGAPREAEAWFSAGLDLAVDDDHRAGHLYGRARARCDRRDVGGTRSDLERLEPLTGLDPVLAARALLVRGDINQKAGELDTAAAQLREAADRLEALGQPGDHSLALRLLGMTEFLRGDETLAQAALGASRGVAADAGILREEAWAIQNLAWLAFRSGRIVEAEGLVGEAAEIFEELDDRGGVAWTQAVEAWVLFHRGDWDRALELVAAVLPETRRRGDPFAETMMLTLQTSMALWSGESVRALELSREAQGMAERADDFTLAVQARALEGRALVSRGRVAEGIAALEQAYLLADRAGDSESRRIAVISNCASSARLGDAERTLRWAARYESATERLAVVGESDLSVSIALALLQRGAVDEAADQISWIGSYAAEHSGMYAEAVGAIVAAAQGDTETALAKAQRAIDGRSTYLDRLLAHLARAAVAHQGGPAEAENLDEALGRARTLLAETDDQISPLLVGLASALCGQGSIEEAEEKLYRLGVDPAGWRRAWHLAAHAGASSVG